ncbi:MAG: helix-turn-helix domain-containing protein [Betaproteobacteria bacterium]
MSSLALDQYVVDVLMPDLVGHDKSPSAFLVYLYLWRMAAARGRAQLSYTTMATNTGLSKASVQRAVAILKRRKLLQVSKASPTAVPDYRLVRPWVGRMPG